MVPWFGYAQDRRSSLYDGHLACAMARCLCALGFGGAELELELELVASRCLTRTPARLPCCSLAPSLPRSLASLPPQGRRVPDGGARLPDLPATEGALLGLRQAEALQLLCNKQTAVQPRVLQDPLRPRIAAEGVYYWARGFLLLFLIQYIFDLCRGPICPGPSPNPGTGLPSQTLL